jgi:hypothetical protein
LAPLKVASSHLPLLQIIGTSALVGLGGGLYVSPFSANVEQYLIPWEYFVLLVYTISASSPRGIIPATSAAKSRYCIEIFAPDNHIFTMRIFFTSFIRHFLAN